MTKDEDVNLPKDVANAKSRMRKAAAKAVFKQRKGSRWLELVHDFVKLYVSVLHDCFSFALS